MPDPSLRKGSDGVSWRILEGDCRDSLAQLEALSVQTCVTSPPYFGLRDYGHDGQIGLEASVEEYVAALVGVFRDVRRVLAADGTVWLNLGDSYAGSWGAQSRGVTSALADRSVSAQQIIAHPKRTRTGSIPAAADYKAKDLLGVPWMVAFALRADGWYLRSEVIWHKPNPMPESVGDRPTKSHEQVFLLSKSPRYFYDAEAIKEEANYPDGPGNVRPAKGAGQDDPFFRTREGTHHIGPRETRNKRTVWTVTSEPFPGAHFAVFPTKLIEPCVLAGSAPGDVVLDPFAGSGTTGIVALRHDRSFVGLELNPDYARLARDRIIGDSPLLNTHAEAA